MIHFHIIMLSPDGNEYINTVFENQYDAAFVYLQIVRDVFRNTQAYHELPVETVASILDDEEDFMVVWSETLHLKAVKCSGGCRSSSWN